MVNVGWTLGEEVLFSDVKRPETVFAQDTCCLLGLKKSQLDIILKGLLADDRKPEYFVLDSTLKGNFVIKEQWRLKNIEA